MKQVIGTEALHYGPTAAHTLTCVDFHSRRKNAATDSPGLAEACGILRLQLQLPLGVVERRQHL